MAARQTLAHERGLGGAQPADAKDIMSAVAEHTETIFGWFERADTTLVTAMADRELRQIQRDLNKELPNDLL